MITKTKTPLAIAVDRGLQYLAAARREPVEKLHARYRSNRQFRRMMNAKGKQALKGRKHAAVQYALENYAKTLSPANVDWLLDVLRTDYRHEQSGNGTQNL